MAGALFTRRLLEAHLKDALQRVDEALRVIDVSPDGSVPKHVHMDLLRTKQNIAAMIKALADPSSA